jgi:hypothetical protein
MMLEGLSRLITLYSINKPREARFGGYPENCIHISGIIFVNKELKIGDTLRIRELGNMVRYWCCLKKAP